MSWCVRCAAFEDRTLDALPREHHGASVRPTGPAPTMATVEESSVFMAHLFDTGRP
jgi:hypothetical protein